MNIFDFETPKMDVFIQYTRFRAMIDPYLLDGNWASNKSFCRTQHQSVSHMVLLILIVIKRVEWIYSATLSRSS